MTTSQTWLQRVSLRGLGSRRLRRTASVAALLAAPLVAPGCAALHPVRGVPVEKLAMEAITGASRSQKSTIDLSLLTQSRPAEYRVGPEDVLAIYVPGVLGTLIDRDDATGEEPPITVSMNDDVPPTVGFPITVRDDGTLSLPQISPIDVEGMTLREVEQAIVKAYTVDAKILSSKRPRVIVTLQQPRTYEVLVVRQEKNDEVAGAGAGNGQVNPGRSRKGTARIVKLPAYQNDVLHALSVAEDVDGLPGLDARNTIYVIRRRTEAQTHAPACGACGQTACGCDPGVVLPGPTSSMLQPRAVPMAPSYGQPLAPVPAQRLPTPTNETDAVDDPSSSDSPMGDPLNEPMDSQREGSFQPPVGLPSLQAAPQLPNFSQVFPKTAPPSGRPQVMAMQAVPLPTMSVSEALHQGEAGRATMQTPAAQRATSPAGASFDAIQSFGTEAATPGQPGAVDLSRITLPPLPAAVPGTRHTANPTTIQAGHAEPTDARGGHIRPTHYQTNGQPHGGYGGHSTSPAGFGTTMQVRPSVRGQQPTGSYLIADQSVREAVAPKRRSLTSRLAFWKKNAESSVEAPPSLTVTSDGRVQPLRTAASQQATALARSLPASVAESSLNLQRPIPASSTATADYSGVSPNLGGSQCGEIEQTGFHGRRLLRRKQSQQGLPVIAGGWQSWVGQYDPTIENPGVVKIPVRLSPGEVPTFTEQDIILQDGDIVFIESRDTEVFYTGGLLGGGQYELPRDYDLRLLEAISIAQSPQNVVAGRSPGGSTGLNADVSYSGSRVVVLRNLPGGSRVPIEISIYDALKHPEEHNIVIQPGDFILVQYTKCEAWVAFIQQNLLEASIFTSAFTVFQQND